MRTSPDRFPEQIDYTCTECWADNIDVDVDSIEADEVRVECPECGAPHYERVLD